MDLADEVPELMELLELMTELTLGKSARPPYPGACIAVGEFDAGNDRASAVPRTPAPSIVVILRIRRRGQAAGRPLRRSCGRSLARLWLWTSRRFLLTARGDMPVAQAMLVDTSHSSTVRLVPNKTLAGDERYPTLPCDTVDISEDVRHE